MTSAKRGRACHCCSHPRIAELHRDLVRGSISKNAVGRKYGLHPDAVHRHARDHLDEATRREIAVEIKRDRASRSPRN